MVVFNFTLKTVKKIVKIFFYASILTKTFGLENTLIASSNLFNCFSISIFLLCDFNVSVLIGIKFNSFI